MQATQVSKGPIPATLESAQMNYASLLKANEEKRGSVKEQELRNWIKSDVHVQYGDQRSPTVLWLLQGRQAECKNLMGGGKVRAGVI